jgi:hypothetical protein
VKRRTLRGFVETNNGVKRLIVDDGNLNHGFKVVEFYILSTDPRTSTADSVGTLALSEGGARVWRLSDNRQIAWAGQTMTGSVAPAQNMHLIDPDHVVLRDLWVWGLGTGDAPGYQYMVVLEPITLTDDESVLHLIKERSQDDL